MKSAGSSFSISLKLFPHVSTSLFGEDLQAGGLALNRLEIDRRFRSGAVGGKRGQKVKIYFNLVDNVEIPAVSEPAAEKSPPGCRKTA